jgi:hypothetical protein
MTDNRVPQGVPSGGQFAATAHPEAEVDLDEDYDRTLFGFGTDDERSFEVDYDRDGGEYTLYENLPDGSTVFVVSFFHCGDPEEHDSVQQTAEAELARLDTRQENR